MAKKSEESTWNRSPFCEACGALITRVYKGCNKPEEIFSGGRPHDEVCPAKATMRSRKTQDSDADSASSDLALPESPPAEPNDQPTAAPLTRKIA